MSFKERIRFIVFFCLGIFITQAVFATPLDSSKLSPSKLDYNFKYVAYFTDVQCWRDGICSGLVEDVKGPMAQELDVMLAQTQKSADFAIYGLSKQRWVLDRVKDLITRKVGIRVVVDQKAGEYGDWDNTNNFIYPDTALLAKLVGKSRITPDLNSDGTARASTIMHNKFVVMDKKAVWMGSTNLSHTEIGAGYSANSSILIDSEEVAKVYTEEFNQMFENKRFSIAKKSRVIIPTFKFKDGTELSVYFSPQDNPMSIAVVPFIKEAKSTLDIGMFFLTDNSAVNELMRASYRGVRVRIIADAVAARHPSSQIERLRDAGVEVRIENWGGKMHMKTAVADGKHVLMGSMNWSAAGSLKNDENTVVIRNNAGLAGEILDYFVDLWDGLEGAPDYPAPESPDSINSCFDGLDNNHSGRVDAQEKACKVFYMH